MDESIDVTEAGPVATVELRRPAVRNAFNAEMIRELTECFEYLAGRMEIRAIVLRGEGASFSAGADAGWMRASLDRSEEENLADALRMSDMFGAIERAPQPVIARVQGAALGGGMGLIAVCDIVVAADTTLFGFTETKLGIVPAVISRFVLPKIGIGWARAVFLTGERFDAGTAARMGLVHWIVPEAELDGTVEAKVNEVLSAGPVAAREAKALIRAVAGQPSEEARRVTASTIARVRTSPEGQEGLRAFLEKRAPGWRKDRRP